ncbi:MAG TPA: thiamine pyrophosphate-dependent enzyme [Allosphingosinicella sp.]|nr:thiamine pyrophosphate-dependent enzyme [Allosphingosinicella sp.]
MAGSTAADLLIDCLLEWDVDTVFGIPGDGINGIMEALRQRRDRIRFVQTRHEEAAALAAVGYAKFTGRLGVCLATSGPGGIHLLNGLYDAKLDGAPVLAVTGLQYHDLLSTKTQQDVELDKLFMDACAYSARIMGASHVESVVDLACRTALSRRQPTHITMPVDLQSLPAKKDTLSKGNVGHHVSNRMAPPRQCADSESLELAAELLNSGKRVFILAGRGALGARAELLETAERLQSPVGMALLGKGAIPDDSPFATGGIGALGTKPSKVALENCDTLLIVGSSFPYLDYYPKPGAARAVQIDVDPTRIGQRYPAEVGLVGDAAATLRALLPKLDAGRNAAFLTEAQQGMADWRALIEERGTRTDRPMKPQVPVHELNKLLSRDAIVVTDSGTITAWTARHIRLRHDQMFSCSGTLSTMGCALPYAIGAAMAYPEREVVAVIGDGGLSMVLAELATVARYELNIKILVIKNDTLGQIKWEQIVYLGNPEYGCDLQPIDFAKIAEACGIRSCRIEDPDECGAQLRQLFAGDGPALAEAQVDPHEPPMPPQIELEQATHFAQALLKGTPDAGKIARTLLSDRLRELT